MPSKALVRAENFHKKTFRRQKCRLMHGPPTVTEVTRTKSSKESEDPAQPYVGSAREGPTVPYVETAWGDPARDNKHQAHSSDLDNRFQGDKMSRLTTKKKAKFANKVIDEKKFCSLRTMTDWWHNCFPNNDDTECQDISQDPKDIVKRQGSLEAHEILMIKDAVQCKSCCNNATPGHRHCRSGRIFCGASDEVKKQVLQNFIICFNILTTSAFVSWTGKSRGKTIGHSEGYKSADIDVRKTKGIERTFSHKV